MKLYVGLDFFYPRVYGEHAPDAEQKYQHDAAAYYVVVQPFVIGLEALGQYARGTAIDALEVFTRGDAAAASGDKIPVPFRAATKLKFEATGTGLAKVLETVVSGADSPLALDTAAWVEFATRNALAVPVRTYQNLLPAQKTTFTNWAYGIAVALRANSSEIERVTPAAVRELLLEVGPADFTSWARDFEAGPATTLFDLVYSRTADGYAIRRELRPPRFVCEPGDQFSACASAFFDKKESYNHWLWDGIDRLIHDPDQQALQKAADTLKRLFGFGERLRWPKADPQRLMVLRGHDDIDQTWLITNVHSLLGLVFRIELPVPLAAGYAFTNLAISVDGLPLKTLAGPAAPQISFHEGLNLLHQDVASSAAVEFTASIARDDEAKNGRFMYRPRTLVAQLTPLKIAMDGVPRTIAPVPAAILDTLDPTARLEMRPALWKGWGEQETPKTPEIVQHHPPRTFVHTGDLYEPQKYSGLASNVKHRRAIRLAAMLRPYRLAGVRADERLFELRVTEDVHAKDQAAVTALVKAIAARHDAWVIIPPRDGAPPLAPFSIKGAALGSGRWSLIFGSEPAANPVGRTLHNAGFDDPARGVVVDLIALPITTASLVDAGVMTEAFNVFATDDTAAEKTGPPVILKAHFEQTGSPSVEGLFERIKVVLSPTVPDGESRPLRLHFANFNKLRLALVPNNEPLPDYRAAAVRDDGKSLVLTFPDALAPLAKPPAGVAQIATSAISYAPSGANERSTFWYSVSHSFTEPVPSSATASSAEREAAVRAAEGQFYTMVSRSGELRQLVGTIEHQYGHRIVVRSPSLDFPSTLEVANPAALVVQAKALAQQQQQQQSETRRVAAFLYDHRKSGNGESIVLSMSGEFIKSLRDALVTGGERRPAALRPTYEAFIEIARGSCSVELERWCFSNRPRLRTDYPVATRTTDLREELPGIVSHLQHQDTKVLSCDALRAFCRRLLGSSYTEFEQNVLALTVADEDIVSWPLDGNLYATTDAIRLGIRIRRDPEAAITPAEVAAAAFTPLPAGSGAVDDATKIVLAERFDTLAEAASQAMQKYAAGDTNTPSPLVESFAWVTSRDLDVNPAAGGREPRELRLEKLYGDAFRYLNFPTGSRPPIAHHSALRYVPHAFVPLQTHPSLGDPETTREFAGYILSVLDEIVNRGATTLIDLAPVDVAAAATARQSAADALLSVDQDRRGIGYQLATLIRPVHAPHNGDALFTAVVEQLKRLNDDHPDGLPKRLEALCARNPNVFSTVKGFGVGLFDPANFRTELYSMQLTKKLQCGVVTPAVDRDQFTFSDIAGHDHDRYVVDVLDDATYANRFCIDEATGALARTAEDVIEQVNTFDDVAAARSLELRVEHYNANWRRGENFYVLPSRTFPPLPVAIAPDLTVAVAGATPWHTSLTPFRQGDDTRPVDVSAARLRQLLLEALPANVELPGATPATRIRVSRVNGSFNINEQARDWYRVDTYLSVYYFVIEADEEKSFRNDRFYIEVESSETPFPQKAPTTRTRMVPRSPLQQWFAYHRTRTQNPQTQMPPPAAVPVDEVVSEIRAWCVEPQKKHSLTDGVGLLRARATEEDKPINVRKARFEEQAQGWKLTLEGGGGTVGTVLAVDVLEFRKEGNADRAREGQKVLRFAVLDEPWRYTRARVKVLRNSADVGGDADVDIAHEFRMTEASEWVAYGRHYMQLDAARLPAEVRTVKVRAADLPRRDWLHANGSCDFGPLVQVAMNEKFSSSSGTLKLWAEDATSRVDLLVRGEAVQVIPAAHPQVGANPISIGPLDPSLAAKLRQELVKQYLVPERAAPALDKLVTDVDKRLVRTADPYLRVTWFATTPERVPLLQVTWPVVWES